MKIGTFGPICQVAYIVDKLDASVQHWLDYSGIGPWNCYRNAAMVGHCRGKATKVVMDVGLSYQGDVQIELIQVTSKTPSPYQDDNGRPLIGMHHIAWNSDDLAKDVAKGTGRGLTVAFEAENPVTKVAYLESAGEPGIMFEFIQMSDYMKDIWTQGVKASRDWDGANPISNIDLGG